ncbi:MAG: YkgJ family cysteine cluster protein [Polyangia bacterium]
MGLFPPVPPEYAQLVARVDGFAADVMTRCAADFSCRAGCDDCCRVELTLSLVEAAALAGSIAALAGEIKARLRRLLSAPIPTEMPRCALLDESGQCAVYLARPLVCRSQGLPLRYPTDVVPVEAVRARLASGVVTVCPLNFAVREPDAGDVLDAERVDQILAVLNHRYAAAHGLDGQARYPLADVASAALAASASEPAS